MMSVLFTAIFSGIELIWDKQFGFLKETKAAWNSIIPGSYSKV